MENNFILCIRRRFAQFELIFELKHFLYGLFEISMSFCRRFDPRTIELVRWIRRTIIFTQNRLNYFYVNDISQIYRCYPYKRVISDDVSSVPVQRQSSLDVEYNITLYRLYRTSSLSSCSRKTKILKYQRYTVFILGTHLIRRHARVIYSVFVCRFIIIVIILSDVKRNKTKHDFLPSHTVSYCLLDNCSLVPTRFEHLLCVRDSRPRYRRRRRLFSQYPITVLSELSTTCDHGDIVDVKPRLFTYYYCYVATIRRMRGNAVFGIEFFLLANSTD